MSNRSRQGNRPDPLDASSHRFENHWQIASRQFERSWSMPPLALHGSFKDELNAQNPTWVESHESPNGLF